MPAPVLSPPITGGPLLLFTTDNISGQKTRTLGRILDSRNRLEEKKHNRIRIVPQVLAPNKDKGMLVAFTTNVMLPLPEGEIESTEYAFLLSLTFNLFGFILFFLSVFVHFPSIEDKKAASFHDGS